MTVAPTTVLVGCSVPTEVGDEAVPVVTSVEVKVQITVEQSERGVAPGACVGIVIGPVSVVTAGGADGHQTVQLAEVLVIVMMVVLVGQGDDRLDLVV